MTVVMNATGTFCRHCCRAVMHMQRDHQQHWHEHCQEHPRGKMSTRHQFHGRKGNKKNGRHSHPPLLFKKISLDKAQT